jgi:circadian clock protein KaiB
LAPGFGVKIGGQKNRKMRALSEAKTNGETFVFQLFVADDEFHSKMARDNLRDICESHMKGRCKIEIVDVFKSFDIALKNNIFLTPALIKVSPPPRMTILGNLNDRERVLKTLRSGEE